MRSLFPLRKIEHLAFSAILITLLLFSCQPKKAEKSRDFDTILEKKELTMITLNSSLSYFIYKDEPMGYDYELYEDFCEHYGLKLNVKVAENATRLIEMLKNGEGDLVAYPVAIQNELKDSVIYCGPEQISHQVLVQRAERGDTIITDVTQLMGKEVYVKHDTKYHQRLVDLDAELGGGIIIKDVEKDTITDEDLIEMVSMGKIKYTLSDEYIAKLNRTYYRNIDVKLPLTFEQRSSWIVRKNSPDLAKKLNEWVETNDYKPVYTSVTKKYFELSKLPFDGELDISTKLAKGQISVFDEMFKKHAYQSKFDWYLLAAIAYQESRFRTDLTSWAGATGLMGLMPRTAQSFGISNEDRKNPDLSIGVSVKLLERLDKMFSKIEDENERLKFVLAAYNGGSGHISDALALTRKYGGNDNKWAEVEKYMTLKSNPEYYNDPVVKNGYFRGNETKNYVAQTTKNRLKFKAKHEQYETVN